MRKVNTMRENKISMQEHNDNAMLIFFGMIMGMIMLVVSYLIVGLVK